MAAMLAAARPVPRHQLMLLLMMMVLGEGEGGCRPRAPQELEGQLRQIFSSDAGNGGCAAALDLPALAALDLPAARSVFAVI